MGCESSHLSNNGKANTVKISIVDSQFMKVQNGSGKKDVEEANIDYDYFISLDCFFDEFLKRYYSKVVTCLDNYKKLLEELETLNFSPNIYVITRGNKIQESLPFNVRLVDNYSQFIKVMNEKEKPLFDKNKRTDWKACTVKVLGKPGSKNSEESIFESALKKADISHEFYNSFQVLEQSIAHSLPVFVVSDYIYHREVVGLVKGTKTKVVCYCPMDKGETYAPQVYSLSNNYLDITQDIKEELKNSSSHTVKCSKIYLYTNQLPDFEQLQYQLQRFDIEVRPFNNIENVIKETTYFYCVTVVAIDSEMKNLGRFFDKNHYLHRVKLISIKKTTELSIKGLYKTIRSIKKGYYVKKAITNTIDIIDKHYDNVKFEQIKKELEANNINCFGYTNLSAYIKTKKFISPFIICNFQERMLLRKYMKQLQCKAKIIIFCNKNKIKEDVKDSKHFAFTSSHFGKIIKFIRKTLIYIPLLEREEDSQFHDKIQKIKNKNKRISALKWGMVDQNAPLEGDNFEFLNIAQNVNNASIKDIQKTVSMLWKMQTKICTKYSQFKNQFAQSLSSLRKIYQLSYPQNHFQTLMQKVRSSSISQLMYKIKQYFQSENQLGVEVNKSLICTQNLPKHQIESMRQYLLLIFLNYSSVFSIPRTMKIRLRHWMSNSLVEKCEVGSSLFCKNFLIAYQDTLEMDNLSKIKLEIQIQYNPLVESQLYLNTFITHKDKYIFAPFSQFKVQQITTNPLFTTVKLKYVKNVEFLRYIFAENVLIDGMSNLHDLYSELTAQKCSLEIIDKDNRDTVKYNLMRCDSILKFRKNEVQKSISIHQNLLAYFEEEENLNSVLINQLTYQLCCFYMKNQQMKEAGNLLKQLIKSNPGKYIREQCDIMIEETLKNKQNINDSNKSNQFSKEAMKTFIWLKDNNSQKNNSDDDQLDVMSDNSLLDEGNVQLGNGNIHCMEINQIGDLEKDNF